MSLYKELYEYLHYLDPDKIEHIYQAYLFALEHHSGQSRDSGERYISHPLAVAIILAKMRIDYQSIIAALLHDVIEDTPVTKEEIIAKFGQAVANLVDGVTKLTQIEAPDKDETQAQNFRKMVLAMSRDIRVILIKLADRLHNMRTVSGAAPFKRHRVAKETLDIYAPIAKRLGMYNMSIELEDLAFSVLYPRRYKILEQAVERAHGKHKEVIALLTQELSNAFSKSVLKDIKILGRNKHLYGIYKKMLTHKASLDNIMDVYAFRIIVQDVDDCYRALGVVHNLYKPLLGKKFRDYIATPKFNGYQSLHTVLHGPYNAPVEIQIRDKAMDQMADDGIAAHWLYKMEGQGLSTTQIRAQQWVNKLLEMQQHASSSSEFFENVKVDLYPDKVFVFTPKSEILELMSGATAVDFAYAVSEEVGNTCVAARVNRRFLPLSTVLSNSQTIAIITSPQAEPNPAWLNFVVTAKARGGIKQYLKNKKREELIVLGKQLLEKTFAELPFDFQKISCGVIDVFIKENGFASSDDLYEDIGLGNKAAILVAYQLINKSESKDTLITDVNNKPLLIRGAEGVAITFADCCCPIPGDPIVGYLNAGYGVDIHTEDCANLTNLREQQEKCLPVSWASDVSGDFRVALSLEVVNELGALAELTQAIAKANANIDGISSSYGGKYSLLSLQLLVKNLAHLERVKRHISNVKYVVGVVRKRGDC